MMRTLGMKNLGDDQVEKLMDKVDKNHDGKINILEFIKFMAQNQIDRRTSMRLSDAMHEAFDMFSPKNERIDYESFCATVRKRCEENDLWPEFTEEELKDMFRVADSSGTGDITLADFFQVLL